MNKKYVIWGISLLAGILLAWNISRSDYQTVLKQNLDFYRITSTTGAVILMRVDYTADNKIENISFSLPGRKEDGQYQYELSSKEGEKVGINFVYKDGIIHTLYFDTKFRPAIEQRTAPSVFSVADDKGQEILFTFTWENDGRIRNVNVKPLNLKR